MYAVLVFVGSICWSILGINFKARLTPTECWRRYKYIERPNTTSGTTFFYRNLLDKHCELNIHCIIALKRLRSPGWQPEILMFFLTELDYASPPVPSKTSPNSQLHSGLSTINDYHSTVNTFLTPPSKIQMHPSLSVPRSTSNSKGALQS